MEITSKPILQKMVRIIKISPNLYRVNDKDCWVKNGEIQIPKNIHDTLNPTERQAIEMHLF